jgi:hypothetical protein
VLQGRQGKHGKQRERERKGIERGRGIEIEEKASIEKGGASIEYL